DARGRRGAAGRRQRRQRRRGAPSRGRRRARRCRVDRPARRAQGPRLLPGGALGRAPRPGCRELGPAAGDRGVGSRGMSVGTALVLVSHSAQLAAGLVEVAAQMAPDVDIRAAGGTDDGRVGTSFDLAEQAVTGALSAGADAVVVLTDLGSATLTAESVLEMLEDERVRLVDAPFVEATVAAAVAAQGGGDLDAVVAAAGTAVTGFAGSGEAGGATAGGPAADDGGARTRSLTLVNPLGLHARPAATVARTAA